VRIASLSAPQAVNPAQSGRKGANLAVLAQAGFPVPPRFVVTTDA
jgi:phosphoenolpyruvate synthase/pyruvate phosphate dikinase